MFSIVVCPACQRQVSLPGGLDPSLSVQCPLCGAEFTVGQVVEPGESLPPAVIPIVERSETTTAPVLAVPPSIEGNPSTPAASSVAPNSPAPAGVGPLVTAEQTAACGPAVAAEVIVERDATATVAGGSIEEELGFADEPLPAAAVAAVSQPIVEVAIPQLAEPSSDPEEDDGGIYRLAGEKPPSAAAEASSDEVSVDVAENPCVDIWNDSPSPTAASIAAAATAEAGNGDHTAVMNNLGLGAPTAGGGSASPIPSARGWQPRGKKSNPIRFFIGLVGSGLLGILFTWVLFSLFQGSCSRASTQQRPSKSASKDPKGTITPDANDKKKWPGLPDR